MRDCAIARCGCGNGLPGDAAGIWGDAGPGGAEAPRDLVVRGTHGIKDDGNFHSRFGGTGRKDPLFHSLLSGIGKNGATAKHFRVADGAIGFHDDAEADSAADTALLEDAGVLRLDTFQDLASGFLRMDGRWTRKQHGRKNQHEAQELVARCFHR